MKRKTRLRRLAPLVLSVLLGLSIHTAAQSAPAAAEATAPAGFRLDSDGTLVHVGSGARFPHVLAGFTRVAEQGYDPSGQYVSVEYRSPVHGSTIVARISLVHIEQMSAKEHYTIMKWLARSYFDESTPLSEGPVVLPDMPKDAVWRGRFRGSREGVPFEFSLTTVDLGYWGARVATAYPEADQGEAEQRLDTLISGLRALAPSAQRK
ncbi:hypothetical protein [Sphingobium sp. BS19]|uniref:hypothetical protein n=1 Tax=Sphingobium sp. BS19 TaxID=3018973 RepID=UPI00065C7725|nr:hypothetical protein [Sphingobium sp. BS19]GLI98215.1 hypothetical protein Sbs19_20330 [Sphingobium sp. BS19]